MNIYKCAKSTKMQRNYILFLIRVGGVWEWDLTIFETSYCKKNQKISETNMENY